MAGSTGTVTIYKGKPKEALDLICLDYGNDCSEGQGKQLKRNSNDHKIHKKTNKNGRGHCDKQNDSTCWLCFAFSLKVCSWPPQLAWLFGLSGFWPALIFWLVSSQMWSISKA